jgi:hypothetical protein
LCIITNGSKRFPVVFFPKTGLKVNFVFSSNVKSFFINKKIIKIIKIINLFLFLIYFGIQFFIDWGLGIGDWGLGIGERGLGIGDWGLGHGELGN